MGQEKNKETNENESNENESNVKSDKEIILKKDKKQKEKTDKKIGDKQQQIDELTDTLKRLQAEFENFKKRIEKEKSQFIDYSKAELIAKMLPVLDSFELALKNTSDHEKFVRGIEMIYTQLTSTLQTEGLRKIEAEGKLDPYKHDVLLKEKSGREEDAILEELQKGYMLKDRVLRHTKVKVSAGNGDNKNTKKEE